jgi:hypothetical protein
MLMRPGKIATLEAWDEHTRACEARLRELAPLAKSLGLTIGVENHLDFTVEELRDLIQCVDSPNVGVMFDVGNTIGTLDDPVEAADLLGPYTVATHYKDFAITETPDGFTFCMVPLGCGSLQLPAITKRLLRHADPKMGMSIEMMNGQHFQVNWLEDGFWRAFRDKSAAQVAATLRHIRGTAIDIEEYKLVEEIDKLPHEAHLQLEQNRMARCISYPRAWRTTLDISGSHSLLFARVTRPVSDGKSTSKQSGNKFPHSTSLHPLTRQVSATPPAVGAPLASTLSGVNTTGKKTHSRCRRPRTAFGGPSAKRIGATRGASEKRDTGRRASRLARTRAYRPAPGQFGVPGSVGESCWS